MQTLATLLANKTQHCWAQHVASVYTPCCVLLRLVGSCWMKFDQFQTSSNTSNKAQQHATTHNMVCKRSQHVGPNNVASCWPTMLRAFAWALRKPKIVNNIFFYGSKLFRGLSKRVLMPAGSKIHVQVICTVAPLRIAHLIFELTGSFFFKK